MMARQAAGVCHLFSGRHCPSTQMVPPADPNAATEFPHLFMRNVVVRAEGEVAAPTGTHGFAAPLGSAERIDEGVVFGYQLGKPVRVVLVDGVKKCQ